MNFKELIENLDEKTPDEQVEILSAISKRSDNKKIISDIEGSLKYVSSPFIRNVLTGIVKLKSEKIKSVGARKKVTQLNFFDADLDLESIKSQAVMLNIGQMIHELEPIIGSLKTNAENEIENFETSETYSDLKLLDELMKTFESWQLVEQDPDYETINVKDVIDSTLSHFRDKFNADIILNVSESVYFITDRSLFHIIISNAIRNSIQATPEEDIENLPIMISAGLTDISFWLSVIDHGNGLSEPVEILLSSGYTTKIGNKGYGLGIMEKAVKSLNGKWDLKNGTVRGAEFFLELPLRK
ncbi:MULTISPECIES: HAMP domain-containing sensor histidine kinase [Erwiniaceae]|uniref:sensor histidine kinase n=1 Tax=Erwiniaceae TaxID=1903409 RepID=UPI00190B284D|nr:MULTISPECIES: HAMP domain-containing sensor histidine kinase [Erwiniaceae]MBK0093338.1 HAMP domain-containing histidine kinase [Erwinia sp. S59]MBK0127597.1 HAMP domain-containing histidine kinase [Pantoea sp. S61]